MSNRPRFKGAVPYVFCVDAGATADWCVEVFGFARSRVTDPEGHTWGFVNVSTDIACPRGQPALNRATRPRRKGNVAQSHAAEQYGAVKGQP